MKSRYGAATVLKILVVCPKALSAQLAGSNLRAMELAKALAGPFDITLAAPAVEARFTAGSLKIRAGALNPRDLAAFDIVISNGASLPARHYASNGKRPLHVLDLYNPFLLEILASGSPHASRAWKDSAHLPRLYRFLLRRAALILCATPQQRDFWIGGMHAAGALRPESGTEAQDFVRIVPFGIPREPPARSAPVLRGVHPGIAHGDRLILWNGGIWNWLDPLTLIRAMGQFHRRRPEIKLLFMGAAPNADHAAALSMSQQARDLAREMGLLDETVFFGDQWVAFERRADYLLEADLAVCLAPESLENLYSYRTRLMDAVWCGVPMICTRGGGVAGWVEDHGGGVTVPPGDAQAVAQAIEAVLEKEAHSRIQKNLDAHRADLYWEKCVAPLFAFCRAVQAGKAPLRPSSGAWRDYLQYKLPSMAGRWRR